MMKEIITVLTITLLVVGGVFITGNPNTGRGDNETIPVRKKSSRIYKRGEITNHEIRTYGLCVIPKDAEHYASLIRVIGDAEHIGVNRR